MGYGNGYMMGGMHGMWWLFWIVLVGIFLFAGWANFLGRRNRSGEPQRDTPHQVLHRRLASGDITPAEYEEHKLLLDRDAGTRHGKI